MIYSQCLVLDVRVSSLPLDSSYNTHHDRSQGPADAGDEQRLYQAGGLSKVAVWHDHSHICMYPV